MHSHRKLIITSSLLALVAILAGFWFRYAGIWLVKGDVTEPADAIVILMGSPADRVLETFDLYAAGLAGKIIMVNNIQVGREALEERGVSIPRQSKLSINALSELGIPDSLMLILPGDAASTRDEADTIAAYIIAYEPDIKSVILVSSAAHMRRASMIFRDAFKDHQLEIRVMCAPSKYSGFYPEQWWKYRENAKDVFLEYVKIANFQLYERW